MTIFRRLTLAWRVLRGCDLAAENERLRKLLMADPEVVSLSIEHGDIEAAFNHSLVPVMAEHLAQLMEITPGKGNYLTADFYRRKTGVKYSLAIQRAEGRTPAQDLADLRARLAAMEPK